MLFWGAKVVTFLIECDWDIIKKFDPKSIEIKTGTNDQNSFT